MKSAPVCVLGMHRSGTSLVARCLNLLGLSLGKKENLMPPKGGNNPAGFWEHLGFVGINDAILERLGGSWKSPPHLPPEWESSPELTDLYRRARELIKEEFAGSLSWAFKDPRTCLTLPFWRQIVPDMHYVLCMRNPVDVAASLDVRDGLPEEKSLTLWAEYTAAAMLNTSGQSRLVIFFEDYFKDREREVERLATFLGKAMPDRGSQRHRQIEDYVRKELRHHESSVLDAVGTASLDLPGKALYLIVCSPFFEGAGDEDIQLTEHTQAIDIFLRRLLDHLHSPGQQRLSDVLDTLEEQTVRTRALEAELTDRNKKIEEILSSRSWRVTAPLRSLAEMARSLGRRKKERLH